MLSLNKRLLVAASVVLVAFLGLTGLALDRAFRESALAAVQERLQAQVYMLLAVADLDETTHLILPEALPEARFSTPGSGLYAWVIKDEDKLVWQSQSLLGMRLPVFPSTPAPGQSRFQALRVADTTALFVLSFSVNWEVASERYQRYAFRVAETQQNFKVQLQRFRRSLWSWFLGATMVLLVVQGGILHWGLKPLRQVAREVREIESGQRADLAGPYPKELQPLTENLNTLIRHSQAHLERYRNALGDLAHSLKTPLAVLRSTVEDTSSTADLQRVIREQIERMNQTVEYQLQRAAASGPIALTAPLEVAPVLRKIVDSLAKVYADKSLTFQLQVDPGVLFYGEEGDLMEIVGNLSDNACKWSRTQVAISVNASTADSRPTGLILEVEDDGSGIPVEQRRMILKRGERADPHTVGHGIGLAVVRSLVEEVYEGDLEIGVGDLGGACVRVRLRF